MDVFHPRHAACDSHWHFNTCRQLRTGRNLQHSNRWRRELLPAFGPHHVGAFDHGKSICFPGTRAVGVLRAGHVELFSLEMHILKYLFDYDAMKGYVFPGLDSTLRLTRDRFALAQY